MLIVFYFFIKAVAQGNMDCARIIAESAVRIRNQAYELN